jgi:hypothetical protein
MAPDVWLSTEEVARFIGGVSARWVRVQIDLGRLPARELMTGKRPTYRVRQVDVIAFQKVWIRNTRDRDR